MVLKMSAKGRSLYPGVDVLNYFILMTPILDILSYD